jgi:radical SAM superfamily enzyme YgiQ (UPF0313 family)
MKVAFINPPAADVHLFGQKANFESPLGLAMLAAYIRQHGHEPSIIDAAAEELSEEQVVARLAEMRPAVVGITANTVMMPPATKTASLIQANLPEVLVVLGGKHVSVIPDDVHQGDRVPFDVSVMNEGEETLLHILRELERCGSKAALLADHATMDGIQGIAFTRDGKLRQTPPRPFIQDLDSLPFPARDLLPVHRYKPAGHRHKRLPSFSMVAIRGCPYPCTFCSEARTTVRFSSPQRVVAEIEHLVADFGAKEITFWDDTMTLNKKWMYDLCDRIIEKKLDIVWSCFAAINTINVELLAKMKAAGCWNIFYGIEAADESVQKHIRIQKFGSVDHVKQVIRQTQAAGIEVRAAFMVGLPGETRAAAMATLTMAKELEPDYAQWNYTVPYPGTQLWNEMRQHGRLLARDWGQFSNWYPAYLPFAYSDPEELVQVRKEILRRFYLRPRYVWGRVMHTRDLHDVRRYAGALKDFLGVLGKARKGRPAPVAFRSRAIEEAV